MKKRNELLKASLEKHKIEYDDEKIDKFDLFYELLIKWNEKINLTTITEYEDVVIKHFIDSILLCRYIDLSEKRIIDVGTGAGFPGIPIKIIKPDCDMILLDSLNKRILFLGEVIKDLNLKRIDLIHGRAEDLAHNKEYRGTFDHAVSRAVANLSTLSEYCIPFLKRGGSFISYKSDKADEEIKNAENAIKILGSEIIKVEEYELAESDIKRKLIIIKNKEKVKNLYPRKAGIPAKQPL